MSEQNTAVTIEQVQELINQTVSGLAGRQQKEFQKMLTPISEQLTAFGTTIEEIKTKPESAPASKKDEADPRVANMERELKEMKAARQADQEKAAKLERENALTKALGGYQFANDVSRDTAFKTLVGDIQVGSDGAYYIGEETLETGVKARMAHLTGLLAPKQVGGSGASSGQSSFSGSTEIKPGMKPEELNAAFKNIMKQMPQ